MFIHGDSDPAKAPKNSTQPREAVLIEKDVEKGLKVVEAILASSDEQFGSRQYILSKVLEFGIGRNPWKNLVRWSEHMNSSRFGLHQYPSEFADYLHYVSKLNIRTAVELGVFWGASSYVTAAVLQRANRDLEFTMVDIVDHIVAFDRFAKLLNIKKCVPNTSSDLVGQEFDLVFIDADHSYMGAKHDWLNLGRYARKAVGFHDIHGHEYDKHDGGIVRAWNETKSVMMDTHAIVEFAHCPVRWMGIGLAVSGA